MRKKCPVCESTRLKKGKGVKGFKCERCGYVNMREKEIDRENEKEEKQKNKK